MSLINDMFNELKAETNRLSTDLRTSIQMNELLLKYRFSLISYINECPVGSDHNRQTSDLIQHIQQLEQLYRPLRDQFETIFFANVNKTIECADIELKNNTRDQMYGTEDIFHSDNKVTVNDVTAIQDLDTETQYLAEDYPNNRLDDSVELAVNRPERTIRCEVKGCLKSFSSRNSLCIHIHRYHKNANSFECFQCKKCFAFRPLLRKHQMSCNQRSISSSNLETSEEQNSLDVTLLQRNVCQVIASHSSGVNHSQINKRSKEANDLFSSDLSEEESRESHSNPKQEVIVCEAKGCLKTLSSRNSLNIHLSRFHKNANTFQCFQCKQCFSNRCLLRHHQSVFRCKQTLTKDQLKSDYIFEDSIEIYSGDKHHSSGLMKRIVCEVKDCGKRLGSQNSLNIHISRYHKNADCFECFQCKQFFANRSALRHHQSVHNCTQIETIDEK